MTRRVLGVIPAKGGSQRVKGKNARKLAGKPLVYHTIREAQLSKNLTDFCVSTDSDLIEILCDSAPWPPKVVRRPQSMATCQSGVVCLDALEKFAESFDAVCLLHPTSPFRLAYQIDQAIDMYFDYDVKSVASAYRQCNYKPFRTMKVPRTGEWENTVDVLNAAIYVRDVEDLKVSRCHVGTDPMLYYMDQKSSHDINTELDWAIAEWYTQYES